MIIAANRDEAIQFNGEHVFQSSGDRAVIVIRDLKRPVLTRRGRPWSDSVQIYLAAP